MRMLLHSSPQNDAHLKGILIITQRGLMKMKIRTTYTERDLDFCYSVLIATVTAMFIIAMIWKVIA